MSFAESKKEILLRIDALKKEDNLDFAAHFMTLCALYAGITLLAHAPKVSALATASAIAFGLIHDYAITSRKKNLYTPDSDSFGDLVRDVHSVCQDLSIAPPPVLVDRTKRYANQTVDGISNPEVILSEPILTDMGPKQIFFICKHEIGHIVTQKNLKTSALMFLRDCSVFTACALAWTSTHLPEKKIYGALTLLTALGTQALLNHYERNNELRSDTFACLPDGDTEGYIDTLHKFYDCPMPRFDRSVASLVDYTKGNKYLVGPKRVWAWIFSDHPTKYERIKNLEP